MPKILVVDDEEALRHILRVRLTARGYLIHEAGTGSALLLVDSTAGDGSGNLQ